MAFAKKHTSADKRAKGTAEADRIDGDEEGFDYAAKKVEVEERQRKKKDARRAREGGKKAKGGERKKDRQSKGRCV